MRDDSRNKTLGRREFLQRVGAGAAAAAGVASCLPHVEGEWGRCTAADGGPVAGPASNLVVEVISREVVDPQTLIIVRPERVAAMLEAGLLALTGAVDPAEAWRRILPDRQAGEIVGLKVNTLLAAKVKTSLEVVRAVADSLQQGAGIPSEEILVWDRTQTELTKADLTSSTVGVPCMGTLQSASDPSGPGYEEEPVCISDRKIHLSRILTQTVRHMINVPVLKNHFTAAFTGCLKNHYGSFSRPQDFHTGCQEHVARLNALEAILRSHRLCVVDGLISVVAGDTQDPADCAPGRLLVGFDPVAIDRRGIEIRDEMCALAGYPAGQPAAYLELATQLGLGSASYERILVELD